MTRPAFLLLTAVGCALGTASAAAAGHGPAWGLALGATLLAVLAHAAGNVINDLHDARNGADAANAQGLYPFTGGSRLIQNGAVTEQQTARLAKGLLGVLLPAGCWLALYAGPLVVVLGAVGLLLAWAYSAPPLRLMSRGLGEPTVALVWFLVVLGADAVQRGQVGVGAASAAAGFALMVAALLLVNGYPDATADARVGKRTLVVRLEPTRAAGLYTALVLGAHAGLVTGVVNQVLPVPALWGLVSLPLSMAAMAGLWQHRWQPERLRPTLALTVAATLVHGTGMAAGFALVALSR